MPTTKPQETAATAKFTFPKKSADIVTETTKVAEMVKANAQFPNQPQVQTKVTEWQAAAASVNQNDLALAAAVQNRKALIDARQVAVANWKRTTKAMVSLIDQVTQGSSKGIKEWGFDVTTRTTSTPTTTTNDPPVNLRVTYSKQMEATVRWKGISGHKGYNLQFAEGNPQTPATLTWGPIIQVAQAHYKPTGLIPGQTITVRVAVQRKTGVSDYSAIYTTKIR